MRSGLSASTTSRLAVLPRAVRRPTSGRVPMSGSKNSRSSARLARGQPSTRSGAKVKSSIAARGPDGNTRGTRSGISTLRPAATVNAAPRARPGRPAAAAAAEAASPWTNARRSRRAITGSRLEGVRVSRSIHRHHDVARLDHGVGVLALGKLQLVGGLVGDRRRHGLSADVDLDVRGGGAFLDVGDLALEDVARAELHFAAPSRGRLGAVKPCFASIAWPSARMNMANR